MKNWKTLCTFINNLIKSNALENELNRTIDSILKTTFNWDEDNMKHFKDENPNLEAALYREHIVQVGREKKRADFVLLKGDIGIVLELKKPGNNLRDSETEDQLKSYMRILGHKYGFLIGNEIICYYDDTPAEFKPYAKIRFNDNNKNGQRLSELLDFNNCNKEKFDVFIQDAIIDPPPPPPPPPPGGEELNKIRDEFIKKGYLFSEMAENYPFRKSELHETKSGGKVGFCIACMKNDETKKDPKIWQILWENFNIKGIYKPYMNEFIEKKKEIEDKFKYNCYILDYPVKNFSGKPKIKLWIIADQNDPLNSLLEIMQNTKEIIGY